MNARLELSTDRSEHVLRVDCIIVNPSEIMIISHANLPWSPFVQFALISDGPNSQEQEVAL